VLETILEHRALVRGVVTATVYDEDAAAPEHHRAKHELANRVLGFLGGHAVEIDVRLMGELARPQAV
jgi:hypothetical protein